MGFLWFGRKYTTELAEILSNVQAILLTGLREARSNFKNAEVALEIVTNSYLQALKALDTAIRLSYSHKDSHREKGLLYVRSVTERFLDIIRVEGPLNRKAITQVIVNMARHVNAIDQKIEELKTRQ